MKAEGGDNGEKSGQELKGAVSIFYEKINVQIIAITEENYIF